LNYDRGTKLALYARFGVPEVWIVDIAGAAVEVFREPSGGAYASVRAADRWEAVPLSRPLGRDRRRRAGHIARDPAFRQIGQSMIMVWLGL
jgi:hypothetical protein